jgi:hypothetical protein
VRDGCQAHALSRVVEASPLLVPPRARPVAPFNMGAGAWQPVRAWVGLLGQPLLLGGLPRPADSPERRPRCPEARGEVAQGLARAASVGGGQALERRRQHALRLPGGGLRLRPPRWLTCWRTEPETHAMGASRVGPTRSAGSIRSRPAWLRASCWAIVRIVSIWWWLSPARRWPLRRTPRATATTWEAWPMARRLWRRRSCGAGRVARRFHCLCDLLQARRRLWGATWTTRCRGVVVAVSRSACRRWSIAAGGGGLWHAGAGRVTTAVPQAKAPPTRGAWRAWEARLGKMDQPG